jgi:hypothetical protein
MSLTHKRIPAKKEMLTVVVDKQISNDDNAANDNVNDNDNELGKQCLPSSLTSLF